MQARCLDLNLPEGHIEDAHGLIDICLADIQHGRETYDIAVQAALTNEQSVLACALEELRCCLGGRFLGLAIFYQFEAQHQALAAHVADDRIFPLEFIELASEIASDRLRVLEKL